jgi:cyclohexadienyl dehydratase
VQKQVFARILVASLLFTGSLSTQAQKADVPVSHQSTLPAVSLLDTIIKRGVLRVGLTGDYEPFSTIDTRSPDGMSGLDVDMARDLATSLGAKLQLVRTDWKSLTPDLLAGRFDIAMGGITITLIRARTAYFSSPVMLSGKTAIALCSKAAKYETLDGIDRANTRVVVNPGGTNESFDHANLHRAQIITVRTNPETFQALLNNEADVMITDAVETRIQQRMHPELCPIHPDAPFSHTELAYMLPRDATFQEYVNQWLTIENETGKHSGLLAQWLGSDPGRPVDEGTESHR